MTDAVAVFPPGWRLLDDLGAPVSGGTFLFYQAGTSTPRTVYSNYALTASLGTVVYTDSEGKPVASQGSSTAVDVFTGTTPYKVLFKDGGGATMFGGAFDNVQGALDTSTFLTTGSTSTLTQPVITKTSNYTVVAADRSKLINANCTGGGLTLTLDAAATLGDNWSVKIRNAGTANYVIIAASEAIAFEGGSFTAKALNIGEAMEIVCDGTAFKVANWTPPFMSSKGPAVIPIVSRVSSAPGSPTPGARYIVSGAFSTYSVGDIIESNGTSFNKYTPATNCGWLAYVQGESLYYSFQSTAWVALSASDTLVGLIGIALKTEMQTATDVLKAVTAGRAQHHPAHPKAHGRVITNALAAGSYGVTSIVKNSTGNYTVTLSTALADVNSTYAGGVLAAGLTLNMAYASATTFTVTTFNASTLAAQDANFWFTVFGAQ